MTYPFVICVATNSIERMINFIRSINRTIDGQKIFLVIVDMTKEGLPSGVLKSIKVKFHHEKIDIPKRVQYAKVMQYKIDTVSQFCDETTIYWNSDDDYVFNPYWYVTSNLLIRLNSDINYLSLLKVVRTIEDPPKNYLGFNLIRAYSCMGGAFCTRFDQFYPVVTDYFKWFGTGNMFDINYWVFLGQTIGRDDNVHIIQNFSLVQHCNLISSYLDQKGSKLEHQYGVDFEPEGNPFLLVQ